MAIFHELDVNALTCISSALRRGALSIPSAANLRAYCPAEFSDSTAKEIQNYLAAGFSTSQLAQMIDLLVTDRHQTQKYEPRLDLVWTGPAPEQFTDRDAAVVVMELFQTVRHKLIISSYVIYNGAELFAPLYSRMAQRPDLNVKLFIDIERKHNDFRSNAAIIDEFKAKFRQNHWPWDLTPEIYFDPRALSVDDASRATLHAKVVVADEQIALITSANLTNRGQNRNIEAGVRIESPGFARAISEQFLSLVEQGLVERLC